MKRIANLIQGVISRQEFLETFKNYSKETRLISIWTPEDYEKFEKTNPELIKKYLRAVDHFDHKSKLTFWDTEGNVSGYDAISDEQAEVLANFIQDNKDQGFLIHCDAGISRSAGISMAIECIVLYDGDRYLYSSRAKKYADNPRYFPNFFVYKKIVETYANIKLKENM